ncbi:oxidoreductase [Streptomyces sp. ADMS]|uniref:oxidoreductase n=1 Tax=Streptomyces sp. ADMS TaxID=3071415 RepID=UPI00296EF598|nr:oxidoreductase [Streptomyces sp. ADMS]MDW4911321.1 oxidoreductase [Streptomyces sp. ADMS]
MLSYEEFTDAERELWDAFPEGRLVELRSGAADSDGEQGEHPEPETEVRAAVLTALLLGGNSGQSGAIAALRVSGARITGRLDLAGAQIEHMFRLENCSFDEPPSLYEAVTRTVAFVDCRLPALDAGMARVEGRLDLRRSTIDGRLSLRNAHVTGGLVLTSASLSEPGGWAVFAGGLVMEGGMFCRDLSVRGGIRLPGAHLPGGLFLDGARIDNPGQVALAANNAIVDTVNLSRGFAAQGTIRLRSAQIADRLDFDGAVLDGADLDCSRMQAGDLHFTPATPPSGAVDLQGARVAVVHDAEGSWPDVVRLEGFVYDSLQPTDGMHGNKAVLRVAWIRREPGYAPQPYEQLASWYRQVGHDEDARRVLLAKQRHYRSTLRPAGRAWGHLLDGTVGYGYRPWLAGLWILALTILGTTTFSTASSPKPIQPGQGPPFNAFVYTLDLLIPIGGLGQRSAWYWTGSGAQSLAYVLIASGWVLTTAVVAGVTRSLNKN